MRLVLIAGGILISLIFAIRGEYFGAGLLFCFLLVCFGNED